jgi:hypothetical protein
VEAVDEVDVQVDVTDSGIGDTGGCDGRLGQQSQVLGQSRVN